MHSNATLVLPAPWEVKGHQKSHQNSLHWHAFMSTQSRGRGTTSTYRARGRGQGGPLSIYRHSQGQGEEGHYQSALTGGVKGGHYQTTGTHGRGTEQQVFVGRECGVAKATLNAVEAAVAGESILCPGGKTGGRLQRLLHIKQLRLRSRDMDFLVTLLCLAEGATRQLATLVGHKTTPFIECQVLEVKHLTRTKLKEKVNPWSRIHMYIMVKGHHPYKLN